MERRQEVPVEANAPVVVTELGPHAQAPTGGIIQDLSNGGVLLKLPHAIPCNTPVRIESGLMLLLCEVIRCEPDGEQFQIALAVRHSLHNLQDLENLNRSLLDYETPRADTVEQHAAVPLTAGKRPL